MDDTLSQYFGAATWKNEKKSKKQKEKEESISSKVTTVPAHTVDKETKEKIHGFVPKDFTIHTEEQLKDISVSDIVAQLTEKAKAKYAAREKEWGEPITRDLERQVLLRNVDLNWMDHIDAMDELRRGISLRSYAQRDPVIEYRVEGSDMYDAMVATIRENTVKMLLTVRVRIGVKIEREQVAKPYEPVPDGTDKKSMQRSSKKVGRNDPCPCGSGKKYKHCCGR